MRDAATIDNFLTGASHSSKAFDEKLLEGQRSGAPSGPTSGRPPAKSSHGDVPTLRQVPAG
jgi:hypothetical protein